MRRARRHGHPGAHANSHLVAHGPPPPPPPPRPTSTPTPTATPVPTATATPTPELLVIDWNTTWQEAFDTFGPSEQGCIRDALGPDLDKFLERPMLDAEEKAVYGCVSPDTVRILLQGILPVAFEDMAQELGSTEETEACLKDFVDGLDIALLMREDPLAEAELTAGWIECFPDLLIDMILMEVGVALGEEDRACLEDWLAEFDAAALFMATDPEAIAQVFPGPGLFSCAPDHFIAAMLEDTDVTLTDSQVDCLKTRMVELDWTALFLAMEEEDSLAALSRVAPDLVACAPALFLPPE